MSKLVTPLKPTPVYYSRVGYPNEGIVVNPGEVCTVLQEKVVAVSGNRPYFTLAEVRKDGKKHQLALWPKEYKVIRG